MDYDKLGDLELAKEQIKLEKTSLKHTNKFEYETFIRAFRTLKRYKRNNDDFPTEKEQSLSPQGNNDEKLK